MGSPILPPLTSEPARPANRDRNMTASAIDDYQPRPEWWLVSQGARKRVATDEKGRRVYDDAEWPRTGINDLADLKAYVESALAIVEGLRVYTDINSVIALEHGKRAVDNVRSWLFNHKFRDYPADPPSVSELDRASVESLLRAIIVWIEREADHKPAGIGDVATNLGGDKEESDSTTVTGPTKRRGQVGYKPDERYAIIKRLHDHEMEIKLMSKDEYRERKKLARNWLIRDWGHEYVDGGGGTWWKGMSGQLRVELCNMRDILIEKWTSG